MKLLTIAHQKDCAQKDQQLLSIDKIVETAKKICVGEFYLYENGVKRKFQSVFCRRLADGSLWSNVVEEIPRTIFVSGEGIFYLIIEHEREGTDTIIAVLSTVFTQIPYQIRNPSVPVTEETFVAMDQKADEAPPFFIKNRGVPIVPTKVSFERSLPTMFNLEAYNAGVKALYQDRGMRM